MNNIEAINIFDFDGTLTTETWPKFSVWLKRFGYVGERRNDDLEKALAEFRKNYNGDMLTSYFEFLNCVLKENQSTISHDELMEGEKYVVYNPGLIEYLESSNTKNYIVSGGSIEFLKSLKVAKYFDGIYASPSKKNQGGQIEGFEDFLTDEKKILAVEDILKKNNRQDCQNVCYVGDGFSDAIAMKYVHNNGGKAIFVHQPNQDDDYYEHNNEIYKKLNADGMIDYCCVANFSEGTKLYECLNRV